MDIVDSYKSLLISLGLTVDENGAVSIVRDGLNAPILVDGKILVLPTQKNLTSGSAFLEQHIIFHPISQSVIRQESKVMKKLRQLINMRLYEIVTLLLEVNMVACCNKFSSGSPTPDQMKLLAKLSALGNVSDKTLAALTSVLNAATTEGSHRLVSIYLRKGTLNEQTYSSVANVTFPIFEDGTETKPKLFGVSVGSKANLNIIRALFSYLIPNSEVEHSYSVGSRDLTAPSLHALLMAYSLIAEELNHSVHASSNLIPNPETYMIDLTWTEGLTQFSKWSCMVPSQAGNEGELIEDTGSNIMPGVNQAAHIAYPATAAAAQPMLGAPIAHATPTLGSPLPGTEKPKTQMLGSPLSAAFASKEKSKSFQSPVSGQSVNHSRAELDTTLQNLELQQQLEREAAALASKGMPQMAGMGNMGMPQMPMGQMQMPQMGMQMPQMGMQQPSMQYMQLMQMLQQHYPPVAQHIMANPQLNQMLTSYPQICMAVMQQPTLLQTPQVLMQMAQTLQSQMGMNNMMPQNLAANSMLALSNGTTSGRMRAEIQKAEQDRAKQIELAQKQLAMANSGWGNMGMNNMSNMNPAMNGMNPMQLQQMQWQMMQAAGGGNGMNFNPTPAPTVGASQFGTTWG